MKKLILKTILITLIAIICTVSLLFGIFSIFSPKTIAKVADKLGNYSVSISYYEKQYDKTKSLDDLYVVIKKIDVEKDSIDAERYAYEMVKEENKEKFSEFCKAEDEKNPNENVKTKEFIASKYVLALFNNSKKYYVKYSFDFLTAEPEPHYREGNPLNTVISVKGKVMTKEQLENLRSEFDKFGTWRFSGDEYTRATNDVKIIKELLKTK